MITRQQNEEVLYADESLVTVRRSDVETLKERSRGNERGRIRLCAHEDVDDPLHEMFIVHRKNIYVRPHKHLNKSESFHLMEGAVDVVLFDETGNITGVIGMGDYVSGRDFFYRVSDPHYHTLLIRSEVVVFHETTNGPFNRSDTIFAPWAPDDSDVAGRQHFLEQLNRDVERLTVRYNATNE